MKQFLTIIFICLLNTVQGQTAKPGIEIKGLLADSISQDVLEFATLSIRSDKNLPPKSVLTKADGSFSINGLRPGRYSLSAISLGYEKRLINIELKGSVDLGRILLKPMSKKLSEVVVTADKPIVKQEVDKLVYDLQADPESKSSTVLEIMRKVPLLSVDGDDNILLRGDANYKILINGKPSSMMERNAREVLKSMPASSLQNIEVITNPSSKYDAEGISGIINIVTNKKVDNGYNGSVNASNRFPAGGPSIGGSGTIKFGKLGLSGFGGMNSSNSPETANTVSRNSFGNVNSALTQLGGRESESSGGYIGTELSWEIDSLNLISGQFNFNSNQNSGTNFQNSMLSEGSAVLQSYRLKGLNQGSGNGMDAALNYQLGFSSNKNKLLTFSYRIYGYENAQHNELLSSQEVQYSNPDFRQANRGGTREQTVQVDYVQPIKKLNIEAGVKAIRRDNDSDFQYFQENSEGSFSLDPDRSNIFENTQQVYGLYNSYQYNLKKWGFKAGFRMEQTIIDADFISSQKIVKQEYLNLIPTLNISRKLKDMSTLSLSYSQRIQRPGIYQLNPFVDRSNPNIEATGNPDLHPTVGSTYSVSYSRSKKGSLNVMLGHNIFTDLIMPVAVYDPVNFITRSSFDNTGRADLSMLNLNVNYPLSKKMNLTMNGGIAYGQVSGIVNNITMENSGIMYNYSASGSYRLERGWRVNASLNGNGPNLSLQGTSNSYIGNSFSLNKDLVKDKLSFSAALNNPFQKYRTRIRESFGSDFNQSSTDQQFYRSFNTSLNYRFGKLKSGLKKNARGIRNDDVSNNSN